MRISKAEIGLVLMVNWDQLNCAYDDYGKNAGGIGKSEFWNKNRVILIEK